MPVNDFEKQVQQQLDEFQLNPSASVWKKVEEEIRDKKRRRIIFFFLLPAFLLTLGFSVYYFLDNDRKTNVAKQPTKQTSPSLPADNTVTAKTTSPAEKKQTAVDTHIEKSTASELTSPNRLMNPQEKSISQGAQLSVDLSGGKISKRRRKENLKKNQTSQTITEPYSLIKKRDTTAGGSQDVSVTVDNPATNKHSNTEALERSGSGVDIKTNDSISAATIKPIVSNTDSAITADIISTPVKQSIKKKPAIGRWGLNFSIGASSNHSEVFSLSKSRYDALSVNSPATPPAAIIPPSSPKPGLSFRLGVVREWKLSARTRISTGLQYSYVSNRLQVGNVVDTTVRVIATSFNPGVVNQVYQGTKKNQYTSRYHFVSLPLEFHWIINKNLPLEWNAGFSLSYLLATNGIVYSSSYGGIYYKDKDAFAKMHYNLNTGFSYHFGTKKGVEWAIGPAISLDMQNLVKDLNDRQYLFYTGVEAKWFFQKRNK